MSSNHSESPLTFQEIDAQIIGLEALNAQQDRASEYAHVRAAAGATVLYAASAGSEQPLVEAVHFSAGTYGLVSLAAVGALAFARRRKEANHAALVDNLRGNLGVAHRPTEADLAAYEAAHLAELRTRSRIAAIEATGKRYNTWFFRQFPDGTELA